MRAMILVLLLLLTACGGAATGAATASGTAVFQVVRPDGTAVPFGVAELQKLQLVTIMSDSQPQEGPSLGAVLAAAGVETYTRVTITGADGTRTFNAADVTPDLILDFNDRGSVKLVSPTLAKADRLRDITRIEVQ